MKIVAEMAIFTLLSHLKVAGTSFQLSDNL